MKKNLCVLFLSTILFWGMGAGLAIAENSGTNAENGTLVSDPVVPKSSTVNTPEATVPVQVPVTVQVNTPVKDSVSEVVTPSGQAATEVPVPKVSASPATDKALKSTANGSIEIEAISLSDFTNHAERKMFEVIMAIRRFSVPYAIFVLTIGGLVLMIPFKMPMQKMLGFGIIGFGMLGFVLIWFGPVLLGIAKGMAQP